MSITLTALQKQRRDTAANWTSANPTLLAGEIGLESDTGYWKVGDGSTAWTSLAYVSGLGAEIPVNRLADGSARQLLQTAANGTDVEWTSNVDVPGTLDVTGAATFDGNVTVQGDLTVNGTTTTIDTTNLAIEDKNIEIGKVATPTDVTADGGGITLKGTTDKTINWVDATDAWTFSEHVNIASGKEYRIAGTKVLDATSLGSGVVSSSLTSVGTIGTGVWQGTAISDTYLATISTAGKVSNSATTATSANTANAIVARDGSGNFSAGTITANLSGNASTVTTNANLTGDVTSVGNATSIAAGVIVDADVNASAAIAGTKISPDFGSQTVTTTGVISAALGAAATPSLTFTGDLNTGIYSPGADQVAISTNGSGRLFVDSNGDIGIGATSTAGVRLALTGRSGYEDLLYASATGTNINSRISLLPTGTGGGVINAGSNYLGLQIAGSEKARLTSTGLGIGTSSPSELLNVAAPAAFDTTLIRLDCGAGIRQRFFPSSGTGAFNWQIAAQANVNNGFEITPSSVSGGSTFSTPAVVVKSDGKVGIGTSTFGVGTSNELSVNGSSSSSVSLRRGDALAGYVGCTSSAMLVNSVSNLPLLFYTNDTERARIDSSGRLLVGTSTSALEKLVLKADGGGIQINRNDSGGSNPTSGQALGSIGFKGVVSANSNAAAEVLIQAAADENHSGSTAGSRLEFHTKPSGTGPGSSPTERMRIRNNGQVLIDRTSSTAGGKLEVYADSDGTFDPMVIIQGAAAGSPARVSINFYRTSAGANVGSITTTNSATAYNTSSDYRLKENITAVTDGIARLQQLKPSRFNFIADPGKTVDGFLAHQVQHVVPEAIHGTKDEVDDEGNPIYQGIDQSKLVPLLTAALQEAIGEIESLKARVAALESA